jgi:AcrR family transcriptional regulator
MRDSALNAPFEAVDDTAPLKMNRRQAAKVRTRHKVIEAARTLFAERGYDPATIRDIARGAGMSTGAVFANFQDKAELFEAVLIEEMDGLRDVLREGGAGEGPVKARLQAALDAGYAIGKDKLPLMQAIVARSWFQPIEAETRARAATKGLLIVINDILRDGVRTGELDKDADTRLITEMLWDAYLSNYRKAAYDGLELKALSERLSSQIDVILAGQVATAA